MVPSLLPDPIFMDNLAAYIPPQALLKIGNETVDLVQKDDDARTQWLRIIEDCLLYLGSPMSKSTQGASLPKETSFYSPTLRQVVLAMSSKIHQTLFPAGEWVGTKIYGEEEQDVVERSDRLASFMNYYLMDFNKGYKSDKELLLFWYVICGCAFSKTYFDPIRGYPISPHVMAEDIILCSNATCLEDSERITHRFSLPDRLAQENMNKGFYVKTRLEEVSVPRSSVQEKAKQFMGIQATQSTDGKDKEYTFLESMRYLHLEGFGAPDQRPLPYLVTVDETSRKVVRLVRNFKEQDQMYQRLNPYTQFKLYSGFGPYGMGMAHLCLDLARAETQMMKELIRAAELSNQPSWFSASGSMRKEKTRFDLSPGSVNTVDTIGNINEAIQKVQNAEPSQTLFQLYEKTGQAIRDLGSIKEITPDMIPANMPATTMVGMLSTMHVLEDSVMNRLYDSFKNELGLLYSLLGEWVPTTHYSFAVPGRSTSILKQDFQKDIVIHPIIDPNVSSQVIQIHLNESILQLATQAPDLYDMKTIHERILRSLKVSNSDSLFKKPEEPTPPPPPCDPSTENMNALKGQPIQAYKWQDHQAHLNVHKAFLQTLDPEDPSSATSTSELHAHMKDHEAFDYIGGLEARMGFVLSDDLSQLNPQMQNDLALRESQAVLQEEQEKQAANPPPIDDKAVLIEELKMKTQGQQLTYQLNQQKLELESVKLAKEESQQQAEFTLKLEELDLEKQKHAFEVEKFLQEKNEKALENNQQVQLDYDKINLEKKKSEDQVEAKAYGDTLKFENEFLEKTEKESQDDNLPDGA